MRNSLSSLLRGLSIGALRHRVTLLRAMTLADEAGGQTRNFEIIGTTWAKIDTADADASFRQGQAGQMVSHRMIMRWRNDLDASCRIALGNRQFIINAVADADEKRRYIVVMAEEIRP